MNQFQISGTVRAVGEVYTSSNFTRVNVIIDAKDGSYDEVVELQFTQDRVAIAASLAPGDAIDCKGVFKGRMGKDGARAWTNLQVLHCNVAPRETQEQTEVRKAQDAVAFFETQDGLPF